MDTRHVAAALLIAVLLLYAASTNEAPTVSVIDALDVGPFNSTNVTEKLNSSLLNNDVNITEEVPSSQAEQIKNYTNDSLQNTTENAFTKQPEVMLDELKQTRNSIYSARLDVVNKLRRLQQLRFNTSFKERRYYDRAVDLLIEERKKLMKKALKMDEKINKIEEQLDRKEQLEEFKKRVEELRTERENVSERLREVGNKLIKLRKKKLESIESNFTAYQDRIEDLQARDSKLTDRLASIVEEIKSKKERIDRMNDSINVTMKDYTRRLQLQRVRERLAQAYLNMSLGHDVQARVDRLRTRERELERLLQ